MTTINLFKGEHAKGQSFTITTPGNSAACGIFMTLGEEYLIGAQGANGQFKATTCFFFSTLSAETSWYERILLANACAENVCDGDCGESQVGVFCISSSWTSSFVAQRPLGGVGARGSTPCGGYDTSAL